jgi:hypothetical protein
MKEKAKVMVQTRNLLAVRPKPANELGLALQRTK